MWSLLQELRIAVRTLAQKPKFALLTILTLALGIGATTVVFTLISGVLLKPLEYPEPERLVTIHMRTDDLRDRWGFSYPDFLDTQHDTRSFEGDGCMDLRRRNHQCPGADRVRRRTPDLA